MKPHQLLVPGDTVELVAPSCALKSHEQIDSACHIIESWGLKVKLSNCLVENNQQSLPFLEYSDNDRFNSLKEALLNPDSQAIWCVRGGYGAMRIMPMLYQLSQPQFDKIVIGYSDITALHLFLNRQWGWQTIHGEMLNRCHHNDIISNLEELKTVLMKGAHQQIFKLSPLNTCAKNASQIMGVSFAGNLSLLQCSIKTPWQLQAENKLLILEEIGEKAYQIDRMLVHLSQSQLLNSSAIIFADFIHSDLNEQLRIKDTLKNFAYEANLPVYKMENVGHGLINRPIVNNVISMIKEDKLFNLVGIT